MRRALIALVIVLPALAAASPREDLDRAREAFRRKDCGSAIPPLTVLLYPEEQLAQRSDLVETHAMLGACYFETGKREQAREEFEKVLQLQPDKSLSEATYSAGAIHLFDDTRADVQKRAQRDAELKKLAEDRDRLRKYRESLVIYETRPYYVNFVPFGAGQFQQHRTSRGLFFAIGEGVTGGAAVGLFLYIAGTYGFDAKVPLADGPRVRLLQQLTIASEVGFIGFYAWGVIDAIRHYKPRVQIQGDDTLLPPDLRDLEKKPKTTSLLERIHVSPMLTPDGVGVGIGWEN